MADNVQIAAYEGGELKILAPGGGSREAALALPLSRLVVKVVNVPAGQAGDLVAYAAPVLQSMSPYPDEPLTVSCEKVREAEDGVVALAAALPEGASDDIAEALDAAKLNVTRVDSLVMGQLRGMWGDVCPAASGGAVARRLLLVGGAECVSLFVLDGDCPCAVRALSPGGDMRREVMLSLLEAEEAFGARPLAEAVVCGEVGDESALAVFAPVRRISAPDPAQGLADRAADESTLNALPASWAEVLEESRFKAKLKRFLVAAGIVWALVMGVLFGVPMAYGFMTDHQKALSKEHSRAYREVKEMRDKVKLVQKYSDHANGALETLLATTVRMPAEGVELSNWGYDRAKGVVRMDGTADSDTAVYRFKDGLVESGAFRGGVDLGGTREVRGKHTFSITCRLVEAEGEEDAR